MMSLYWRARPWRLVTLATTLLLLAAGAVLMKPWVDRWQQLQAALARVEAELVRAQALEARREMMARERSELIAEFTSLGERLPAPEQHADFLAFLQEASAASGMVLTRLQYADEQTQGRYVHQPLELSGQGPYRSVVAFLQALERYPRALGFAGLNVVAEENAQVLVLHLRLVLHADPEVQPRTGQVERRSGMGRGDPFAPIGTSAAP